MPTTTTSRWIKLRRVLATLAVVAAAGALAPAMTWAQDPMAEPTETGPKPLGYPYKASEHYIAKERIKIAFWNAEHFVDDQDDPNVDNDMENGGARSADVLKRMGEAIRRIDADVFVFAETEGEAWIRRFAREQLDGMNYDHIVGARDETWHQNIVVMSRVPLGGLMTMKGADAPIVGEDDLRQFMYNNRMLFLEVHANPEYKFVLGLAHIKAGAREKDLGTRLGQVDMLKDTLVRMQRALGTENGVIFGDMNFEPSSKEYERLMSGNPVLFDPFKEQGYPATHPAEFPRRHIDMLLVNEGMKKELVPGSVAVANPFGNQEMAKLADHLPVVATFSTKDK